MRALRRETHFEAVSDGNIYGLNIVPIHLDICDESQKDCTRAEVIVRL